MFHASLVLGSHFLLELTHFGEIGVEDAAFAPQRPPLGRFAPFRFLEEGGEDLTATTHRGEPDPVRRPGEGILRDGDLHRRDPRVLRGDFSHLLVQGDGIAVRRAKLSAGQPNINAVVVVAEAARVMQTADGCDDTAVLLQRL